jgi:hypothetical protein
MITVLASVAFVLLIVAAVFGLLGLLSRLDKVIEARADRRRELDQRRDDLFRGRT